MSGSPGGPGQDVLRLRLKPRCRVGCYQWEKEMPRELVVALEVRGDWRKAGRDDDLSAGFDYEPVCRRLVEFCEGRVFELVEAIAEGVAALVCRDFGAAWVKVTVVKREALPALERVEVEIERHADEYR